MTTKPLTEGDDLQPGDQCRMHIHPDEEFYWVPVEYFHKLTKAHTAIFNYRRPCNETKS